MYDDGYNSVLYWLRLLINPGISKEALAAFMNIKHLPEEESQEVICEMYMIDLTWSIEISLDKLYGCYIFPVVMFHSNLLRSLEHVLYGRCCAVMYPCIRGWVFADGALCLIFPWDWSVLDEQFTLRFHHKAPLAPYVCIRSLFIPLNICSLCHHKLHEMNGGECAVKPCFTH